MSFYEQKEDQLWSGIKGFFYRKMNKLTANQVFTPSSQAIYCFVERTHINNKLVDALKTPGKQIVIYGLTGSGKSTILYNKLIQTYEKSIEVSCTSHTTFEELLVNSFDQLNEYYLTRFDQSLESKLNIDLTVLKSEIKNQNNTSHERVIPPQLSLERLIEAFGKSNACWLIEDFHRLNPDSKK